MRGKPNFSERPWRGLSTSTLVHIIESEQHVCPRGKSYAHVISQILEEHSRRQQIDKDNLATKTAKKLKL